MQPAGSARRPSQAERVETARERLLDAAAEVVVERGFHAATAAQIAERAGYSREMVRVRFGSKLDLMRELLVTEYQHAFRVRLGPRASALERLRDGIDQLAAMSTTAPTRLRAAYVLAFESATSVPELRDDLVPWIDMIEALFADLLRAAVAEGSIRDVDCDEYARLLNAAGTGGAFRFLTSPIDTDPSAPMRTILNSILR